MINDNKFGVYTIYDKVAKRYSPPNIALNEDVAVRQYMDTIENCQSPFDFEMYRIATYDLTVGKFRNTSQQKIDVDRGIRRIKQRREKEKELLKKHREEQNAKQ